MRDVFEVKLLLSWIEGSKERFSPYWRGTRDAQGRPVPDGGYIWWSMGPGSERDVQLQAGQWVRLPDKGGKRLANYFARQPWAEVRMYQEPDDDDSTEGLDMRIKRVGATMPIDAAVPLDPASRRRRGAVKEGTS